VLNCTLSNQIYFNKLKIEKSCSSNFFETDNFSQFHQHFTSSFFTNFLSPKKYTQTVNRVKLCETLSYKKSCWNRAHRSISSMFYSKHLRSQIPKVPKNSQAVKSFLNFWDLRVRKLLIEYCWNWHLESISLTFHSKLLHL